MRLAGRLVSVALLALWTNCSSPPSTDDASDVPCTYETCRATCVALGRDYGSCSGGICRCTGQADADADVPAEVEAEDGREGDDRGDADEATGPCDGILVPVEERPGASAGVTCRRVSVDDVESHLMYFSGDGGFLTLLGGTDRPRPLWLYDRSLRCLTVLDDAVVSGLEQTSAGESSVEGRRVAYYVAGVDTATGFDVWQLRLTEIPDGTARVLVETRSERQPSRQASMDFPTLHYPWVTWRDVRQVNVYRWLAYAYNIETGEERNLSRDPDSGSVWATVMVDSDGRQVVFTGTYVEGTYSAENVVTVDLVTGERGYLAPQLATQDWPTITPEWIVWLDQRTHPECDYMSPCYTDVYGYRRSTGEVVPLVVAGESMQGPWIDARGDWVAYEDQRDGTDVTRNRDNEQDIYAFHLPTGTEVRITDWAGFEWNPQVYDRHDGTFGVLLIQELDYLYRIYRLWDCDLPAP